MDYRYLKAFYLTGKTKSFSQAARDLRIAQSAVSRQIKLLEQDLGFQLLLRAPGSVRLTTKGEELMQHLGLFNDWAKHFEGETQQVVRIACLEGVGNQWLSERLALLKEENINFEVSIGTAKTVRRIIEDGEADLAILGEKVETAIVSSVLLFRESFELIASFEVNQKALTSYRWIFPDTGSQLRKLTRKEPSQYIRTGSVASLLELVRRGAGIAILPSHLLSGESGFFRYPIKELRGSMYLAMLNYDPVPPAIDLIRKTLLNIGN